MRFAAWQIKSRLQKLSVFDWIGGAKLYVSSGMTGATGNIYCGLHEFADMAFLLHFLRSDDTFIDVGANIGSYTILASKVCGAKTIAIEPDPITWKRLSSNIILNDVTGLASAVETALGDHVGSIQFTKGQDTTNQVAMPGSMNTQTVPLTTLDALLFNVNPTMIKLDVEGFEAAVIAGAKETLSKASLKAIETESDDELVVGTLTKAGFLRYWYNPMSRRLSREPFGTQSNALFLRSFDECQERLTSAKPFAVLGKTI
jgi:FkbM family methyltransferase